MVCMHENVAYAMFHTHTLRCIKITVMQECADQAMKMCGLPASSVLWQCLTTKC